MRVDTPAPVLADEIDPRARLRRYVSAFRRRWYLVVLPVVLGAALGWFTAPNTAVEVSDIGIPVPRTTYYQASHVLIQDQSSANVSGVASVNLSQAAYLANTGQVPVLVAEQLGLSADDVEASVIGLPRSEVSSVEVLAIGTDPDRVVELADAAAANLVVVLEQQADADFASARDEIVTRLEELDTQLSALNDQIAADPPNRLQLEAQQRSLANQYSTVYEQFTAFANAPEATAGLSSLEGAKAQQISETEYQTLRRTIREGASYVTGVQTTVPEATSEPEEPAEAVGSSTRSVLGAIVGGGLGVGLVLLLERFDGRARRREAVEQATGLTVIAEIPPLKRRQQKSLEVVATSSPRSRSAEAYRVVRGAVLFALTDVERHDDDAIVIMVTSPNPGEGKTTTVANLAAVLAEGGLRVLVVNCDFRRPRVHAYLLDEADAGSGDGVATIDTGKGGTVRLNQTTIPGVRLVTGLGENDPEANPLDVVALQRKVVDLARPVVDVILLDTAPFLATNDASELLGQTDQVLLVVRAGKTTTESAHRTAEVLERFDAPVLGVVFNASAESPAAQYYYGYGDSSATRRAATDALPEPPTGDPSAPLRVQDRAG